MKVPGTSYLVGGAVRDELLGLPVKERDWVVVGSSAEEMLEAGFLSVGKQFPVFLHPNTHEEYALARQETKIGPGHGGFSFNSDSKVTLEQDLLRRDLTINAIAKASSGALIDPYGGERDLERKVLRHVSNAFSEDPLRCLRLARFAAKLPDFTIANQTIELVRSIGKNLAELPAERVWNEWIKAIQEKSPARFYETLQLTDTVEPWFCDLDVQQMVELQNISAMPPATTFAYIGWYHEEAAINAFFDRLKSPKKAKNIALRICRFGPPMTHFESLSVDQALDLLEHIGAFHSNGTFESFLEELSYVKNVDTEFFQQRRNTLRQVKISGTASKELADRIRSKRLEIMRELSHRGS